MQSSSSFALIVTTARFVAAACVAIDARVTTTIIGFVQNIFVPKPIAIARSGSLFLPPTFLLAPLLLLSHGSAPFVSTGKLFCNFCNYFLLVLSIISFVN